MAKRSTSRGRRVLATLLAIGGVILLFRLLAPPALEAYARWLIVEDPLPGTAANAVAALSGGDGMRLQAAISLYGGGAARSILIVGTGIPVLKVYAGEDSLTQAEAKRRIAVRRGVPADSIVVALGPTSTWEEALRVRDEAKARGWTSLIVVTDAFHTRRARATFRHVFRGGPTRVAVYHLPLDQSTEDPRRWWRRESETMDIFEETVKMGFYMRNYGVKPWE